MISAMRKKRFFTQISIYDLSLKTGIDPARISLIERGYKTPRDDEKEKISRVFGCEVEELFPPVGQGVTSPPSPDGRR